MAAPLFRTASLESIWPSACDSGKTGTDVRNHSPLVFTLVPRGNRAQKPRKEGCTNWPMTLQFCACEPANLDNPTAITKTVTWCSRDFQNKDADGFSLPMERRSALLTFALGVCLQLLRFIF